MSESHMTKCDPSDPHRCQATVAKGQCPNLATEGSKYCLKHTHNSNDHENRVRHYLLSNPELQTRLNRHAAVEEVRSLREEIHLARMMVEARLDLVEEGDRGEMLAAFSSVNTLLQTVEKLVSSCHRMEISLGGLLSKGSVLALGQEIVMILVDELQEIDGHEEIIDCISERVIKAIAEQGNKEKEP